MKQKFYSYPAQKKLMVLYTSPKIFKSPIFQSLIIQISPNNTFLLRLRRTILGHWLYVIFTFNRKISTMIPKEGIELAYINHEKQVLFEFNNIDLPVKVYKGKRDESNWNKNDYFGLPLITEYSKKEFNKKWELIQSALEQRWKMLMTGNPFNKYELHGDFTHFNILISNDNLLIEIDQKEITNSILFDHFYFYAYLCQCLSLCSTLSKTDREEIQKKLDKLIIDVCVFDDYNTKIKILNTISLKDAIGLQNPNYSFDKFKQLFLKK